jgi:hypothetical protein
MRDEELARIRDWAQSKIDALDDLDWTRDRCLHIVGLVDQMLGPQAALMQQHRAPQFPPML